MMNFLCSPAPMISLLVWLFVFGFWISRLMSKIDDLLELANNQNGRIEAASSLVDLLMRKLKILENEVESLSRD